MGKEEPNTLRLEGFVPYRLSVATNAVSDVIATAYRELFGLSIPEWRLVAVLAEQGSATQLELGSFTVMDKVTVSRAAIALAKRGFVRRSVHPSDKRSHLLSLTRGGKTLYEQIAPKALALEKELLGGLTRKEIDHLLSMLRRLQLAAEKLDARESAMQAGN